MAKARAIIKRRKAVQNIRKITRTMQLIATARFQAAVRRATATKPYTEGITRLVEQVARHSGQAEHPLLRVNTESKRAILIGLTSNRGLCGGYNAAVMRAAIAQYRSLQDTGLKTDIVAVGKKLIAYFKFLNVGIWRREERFGDQPRYAEVEALANELIELYERRQVDAVYVTYTKFVSTSVQRVETMQLLPLEKPAGAEGEGAAAKEGGVQWEFIPSAKELLEELLPETVRIRLFQAFIDAVVSEQVARMVAMKAATDNAQEMAQALTLQYNRARQGQITTELSEIMGGVEAMKG
jgi:F-type H+-transporting ATPase subunit gamma